MYSQTKLPLGEVRAYCEECGKTVVVFDDQECDETGEVSPVPTCRECLTAIRRCHDCPRWVPDSKHTPLGQTMGSCLEKGRVHAMDLVCPKIKEPLIDDKRGERRNE